MKQVMKVSSRGFKILTVCVTNPSVCCFGLKVTLAYLQWQKIRNLQRSARLCKIGDLFHTLFWKTIAQVVSANA